MRDFVYGWVSKYQEINFPYTILKNLLSNAKIFLNNFINIFKQVVNYRGSKEFVFRFIYRVFTK
jgi:hypothetical protein